MATEIIDGVGPQNHVTSDQVGLAQEGTIGAGAIILPVGQQLGYDIVSNNQVNIKDGVYLIQGKRGWIRPGTVEQCTIDTGNNGQYRNDLICVKYTKNAQSKVEEFSVEVVKGTPGAAGTDPTYTTGDINDGALESYAPIYRVRLNGINIIGVDLVASKIDSLLDTAKKIGNLSELTTSAKTSLVAAANELKAAIGELNGNIDAGFVAIENAGIVFSDLSAKIVGSGKNGYLFINVSVANQLLTQWQTYRVAKTTIRLRDTVYANIINDFGVAMLFTLTTDGYLDINSLDVAQVDVSSFRGCIPLCFA